MAIIFPQHIKGMTAGALRQIKQQGFTTAGGGHFHKDWVEGQTDINHHLFLKSTEPTGRYMDSLQTAATNLQEMKEAIRASARQMVSSADEAAKEVQNSSAKMRDATEKLASAMRKFSETAGTRTFAEAAQHTQSMVEALERLAALQERGLLEKVMSAMAVKK